MPTQWTETHSVARGLGLLSVSQDQGCYAKAGFHLQRCLARIYELNQRRLAEQERLQRC